MGNCLLQSKTMSEVVSDERSSLIILFMTQNVRGQKGNEMIYRMDSLLFTLPYFSTEKRSVVFSKSLKGEKNRIFSVSPQSRSLFSASFQTFCWTWIRNNTDCFAVYHISATGVGGQLLLQIYIFFYLFWQGVSARKSAFWRLFWRICICIVRLKRVKLICQISCQQKFWTRKEWKRQRRNETWTIISK